MSPVSLHFEVLGQGADLVILHGLFGSGNNWRTFARKLESRFRIWLLDLRNHGHSPHTSDMSYPLLVADVLNFLDEHQLSVITLLGHSMGGKTAMQLALRHPHRVRRLIVGDIAPVSYVHGKGHQSLIQNILSLKLSPIPSRKEADHQLTLGIPDPAIRAFLLKNLELKPDRAQWRINLPVLAEKLDALMSFPEEEQFRPYEGPTLFVGGEKSDYIQPESHAVRQRWFPSQRLVMLKDCGHWLHVDQPEALHQTLGFFFSAT